MNPFARIMAWLKPGPKSPEEIEAEQEADRVQAEMKTIRLSQESSAGSIYQSGRGSGHEE
jgi:hypothetical protein